MFFRLWTGQAFEAGDGAFVQSSIAIVFLFRLCKMGMWSGTEPMIDSRTCGEGGFPSKMD